ncbi:MAG: glucuronosyltransferase [Planctomycetes bacterium]|nr:glucuronosyltransferase [Planctomycetota bacterium]
MIFVTVGTQIPFDRLVKAVDRWADLRDRTDLFAQIGPTSYEPKKLDWVSFLDAEAYAERLHGAQVLVAHAGMGSILKAMQLGKPILIMPRRADLGEHRNDHQMATAERFKRYNGIQVAYDEEELFMRLDALEETAAEDAIGAHASRELLDTIKEFINRPDR